MSKPLLIKKGMLVVEKHVDGSHQRRTLLFLWLGGGMDIWPSASKTQVSKGGSETNDKFCYQYLEKDNSMAAPSILPLHFSAPYSSHISHGTEDNNACIPHCLLFVSESSLHENGLGLGNSDASPTIPGDLQSHTAASLATNSIVIPKSNGLTSYMKMKTTLTNSFLARVRKATL